MVEEDVGNMELDVVEASYTEDASLVVRKRLSGLKLEGSLRDYVKEFTEIVGASHGGLAKLRVGEKTREGRLTYKLCPPRGPRS